VLPDELDATEQLLIGGSSSSSGECSLSTAPESRSLSRLGHVLLYGGLPSAGSHGLGFFAAADGG